MGANPSKKRKHVIDIPIDEPSSVYVPLESLTQRTVRSIISVVTSFPSPNFDYSERTLLIFLLAINDKLKEIENNADTNDKKIDEQLKQRAQQVRQWLVNRHKEPLDWDELQRKYDQIAGKKCTEMARCYRSKDAEPYFEIRMETPFEDVKRSRVYMEKFRENGFEPKELKLYWNAEQLENLCPKSEELSKIDPPHDPSDDDAIANLCEYPVCKRNNSGKIEYVNKGIEKAVFDVPKDVQIILLNFANEQSPGGGYLRHARAQEEVILYNSDGYRALLDLKYKRMNGGYAIPEFGLAYVRNMCFFDSKSKDKHRLADMLVSACYCLNGAELYENPSKNKWEKNNLAKFEAFMAAAVANTIGDGSKTYLLLGPIGTGAFGNDVYDIAEVFRKVLEMKMMNSDKPIRYAFEQIWFVSTEEWKNEAFKEVIEGKNEASEEVIQGKNKGSEEAIQGKNEASKEVVQGEEPANDPQD